MKQSSVKHHMDGLIALLLFGVFAACVLVVLLTGADAYRRLTQRDQTAYDQRTCIQYLATRVRQADYAGGIRVTSFGGGDALLLNADSEYPTWLYCQDGYLMELYCWAEEPLPPEDGQRLMAAEDLSLHTNGALLTISVTAGGEKLSLTLSLRSDGDAGQSRTPDTPGAPEVPADAEIGGMPL